MHVQHAADTRRGPAAELPSVCSLMCSNKEVAVAVMNIYLHFSYDIQPGTSKSFPSQFWCYLCLSNTQLPPPEKSSLLL